MIPGQTIEWKSRNADGTIKEHFKILPNGEIEQCQP